MKKNYVGLIVYNVVLLAASLFFSSIKKADMVIYLGVTVADILPVVFWILILLLFAVGNLLMVRRILIKRKIMAEANIPDIQFTGTSELSPDEVRRELIKYKPGRPKLSGRIDTVLEQMDSMDRKQAKLQQIFSQNKVETLHEVEQVVDQAEQAMCRNNVKILNRVILWDPLEWNKAGKEQIYAQHTAYIEKYIGINEDILSKCDILLSETVDYVNEKNDDMQSGQMHLDVMTETVQALRAINRIGA